MLLGRHESPSQATETAADALSEQGDKPPDECSADKGGLEDVAHIPVTQGLSTSSDVTEGDNEKGLIDLSSTKAMPHKDKERQEIAHPVALCQKRREGDSNSRYLAVRRFSRPVHSATLPSLRVLSCNEFLHPNM